MPPRRRPSAASLVLALDTTAHGSNASAFVGGNSPQTARSDSSSSTTSSVSTTIDGAGEGSDIAASGSGGGDFDAQLRSIRSENERRLQASSERPRSVTAEGEVEEDCEAVNKRAVLDAKCWKIVSENRLTIDRCGGIAKMEHPQADAVFHFHNFLVYVRSFEFLRAHFPHAFLFLASTNLRITMFGFSLTLFVLIFIFFSFQVEVARPEKCSFWCWQQQ
jgi:hypothetical protein